MLDQVYGALADPTRRAILSMLAAGETNVGTLAGRFPISLNGVSKHVKILERAGLIERTVHGREHRLRLNAEPLRDASVWLEHYRTFWDARLAALEAFLLKQEGAAGPEQAEPPREDGR
jgi:DNA-binding transcriptional ArsR family regulator